MNTLDGRLDTLLHTFQTMFDLSEVPSKTFEADGHDVEGLQLFEVRGPNIRWGRVFRLATPNTLSVMLAPSYSSDLPWIGLDLMGTDTLGLAILDVVPLAGESVSKIAVYLEADVAGMRASAQHLPPAVQAMLGPHPWMGRGLEAEQADAMIEVTLATFSAWKTASQHAGKGPAEKRKARIAEIFGTHHTSALSRGTFQTMFGSDEAAEHFVKSFFFPI